MSNRYSKAQMKKDRYFGLNRNIFFSGLTSFLTDTSVKMVYSVMPLFLISIGASKTTLSLIEGIAESTASLLKAVSGFWSDKIGRNKPFMIIGYGITALITPIYAFVTTPFQVLIFRFIERVGKGIRTAPRDSLISSSILPNEGGKSFGFHKAMDNSGAIVGPLLAAMILTIFSSDYRLIFLIASVPAVLGVITIMLLIKDTRTKREESKVIISLRQLPRRFYFFLIIVFVFALGNSTDALLLVRTSETGIRSSYVPFIYMIFNTVSVFLAIPVGKLSDRIGRSWLIVAGFLIYAVVYALFGTFNNIRVFIFAFVLYGCYSALTDTTQKAMISDITGREVKGTGFGLYHAVVGITLLPASLIAGMLYDRVNPGAAFYFGAAMALTAVILMIFYIRYYRKDQVQPA